MSQFFRWRTTIVRKDERPTIKGALLLKKDSLDSNNDYTNESDVIQRVLLVPRGSGQVDFFVKDPTACAPESLHRACSRHIVLTALAASQCVTCLRAHSTGLTQNMLTSASFSQKPIKLIVGHIIRLTDRVRWRIVNECRTGGKTRRLIGTEYHTNQRPSLDEALFPLKNNIY